MKVNGLAWLGTKTDRFDAMVRFYEEVMDLVPDFKAPDFAVYRLPGGETVEVFGPSGYDSFSTGPVAGFLVDDVPAARAEMEAQGIAFLGDTGSADGHVWAHFRAPDGNVYEITSVDSTQRTDPQP